MKYLLFVCAVLFGVEILAANKVFNPDISMNALTLFQNGSNGNGPLSSSPPTNAYQNGVTLDEAELILSSDVDVYAKFMGTLSIHKENNDWKIEPEEVYAESLNLDSLTLRIGKFKAFFGKYNNVHKHALPFIDPSLIANELFGDEGLNGAGVGAAYLLPTSWFSEFTVQAVTASDSTLFNNSSANAAASSAYSPGTMAEVGRWRNLFDLSDSLTMEIGVSGVTGQNDMNAASNVGGGDLTFKWRPVEGGKYHALIWSTEYMTGVRRGNPRGTQPSDIATQGVTSFVQWQMAERWWLQGRTEYLDQKNGASMTVKKRQSALVGFMPTEFSGFRLQYDYTEDPTLAAVPDHKVLFQVNLSIGAHPAHAY